MRKIAVINQKGGVGKTTITTNLGHALAMIGYRVTVIDLDPLGQLATSYGLFRPPKRGIDRVMLSESAPDSVQIGVRDLLKLIPAGDRLNEVEELRDGGIKRAKLLRNGMNGKMLEQDFILIDCPPSSGVLVANAIFTVEEALIPVGGDYLSLDGLAKMMITLKKFEPYLAKPLKKMIVLNRFNPRRRLAKEVFKKVLQYFPDDILSTQIREAAVMAECPGVGRTIFDYRATSRSAQDFTELAHDLEMRRELQW